jgi:putative endonuclease
MRAAWIGRRAERAAARFLVRRGLRIIARNYRTTVGEIDLVMRDGDELVFIEVRYRSRSDFGDGAATVDRNKQHRLISAATHFIHHRDTTNAPCRFDVMSVSGPDYGLRLEWIRNAFTP